MNNARAILVIYDLILSGKTFCVRDLIEKSDSFRRTCFRYRREIRFHLIQSNSPKQIYYDKRLKRYELMDSENELVKTQNGKFLAEYRRQEKKEKRD